MGALKNGEKLMKIYRPFILSAILLTGLAFSAFAEEKDQEQAEAIKNQEMQTQSFQDKVSQNYSNLGNLRSNQESTATTVTPRERNVKREQPNENKNENKNENQNK
jgi:hypothetical protein